MNVIDTLNPLAGVENDIPNDVAYNAHRGTSFVPEDRARQEKEGFAQTMQADYAEFLAAAEKHGTVDQLAEQFQRYRDGYKRRTLDYLGSRNGWVSTMIAGGSNFPVRRMEKKFSSVRTRLDALVTFRKRARAAIFKKLAPTQGPIMAGQADAVELLAAKIANAERLQAAMREANKIARSKKHTDDEKIAAMIRLGLSERSAAEALKPDYMGRIGFPDYALKNNNANIRRMRERLESVSRAKTQPETAVEGSAARFEDSPADNRVRLFFPGKPDAAVRDHLKLNGFRWTPSLGCWQAYRNDRSAAVARKVASM